VLGGGGYTKTTVARAWTLETGAPACCGCLRPFAAWPSPAGAYAVLVLPPPPHTQRLPAPRLPSSPTRPPTHPPLTARTALYCPNASPAAVLCDQEVEDTLPQQMYLEYFSPDYRLNYNRRPVSKLAQLSVAWLGGARCWQGQGLQWFMPPHSPSCCPAQSNTCARPLMLSFRPCPCLQSWPNQNKREEVERIKVAVLEQLQQLQGAPGGRHTCDALLGRAGLLRSWFCCLAAAAGLAALMACAPQHAAVNAAAVAAAQRLMPSLLLQGLPCGSGRPMPCCQSFQQRTRTRWVGWHALPAILQMPGTPRQQSQQSLCMTSSRMPQSFQSSPLPAPLCLLFLVGAQPAEGLCEEPFRAPVEVCGEGAH
jgi:hypothetical protein